MRGTGKRSVTAGGDVGVAVTGDHNHVVLAPVVRSSYGEQVRRIAPDRLVGRETELAELAAFCCAESGPSHVWWRADAWAGKTALLSWFALHPPPGVRVVPFFVTGRLGAHNDVVAYVDVVLEQLVELTGAGLPAYLTEATREAHLLRLYGEAARACSGRGERLILLVDGLDEDRGVTTGPGAHSIASLLPGAPEAGMRVVVSGRFNPPLPPDVPGGHPLRAPDVVRQLAVSPAARAIRTEAERELKHLLEAPGLEHDLLALVTAAGGGLSAGDLTALTEAVPFRVADALRTRTGRTFATRGGPYLLAHDELRARAEEMLGARELGRWRERLHDWAKEYGGQGWPVDTPEYLLRGYFAMLRSIGDADRMTALALDRDRQARMWEITGGNAAALAEIRWAQEVLLEVEGEAALSDMLALAISRDELQRRGRGIAVGLPGAWARIGCHERAEALAHSLPLLCWRSVALGEIALEVGTAGEREEARRLLADAERAAREDSRDGTIRHPSALSTIRHAWVTLGETDRALSLVCDAGGEWWLRDAQLGLLVEQLVWLGEVDAAESVLAAFRDAEPKTLAVAEVVGALADRGEFERAESLARSIEGRGRAAGLVEVAYARREAGAEPSGVALFDEAVRVAESAEDRGHVVEGLAWAGMFDRAEALASRAATGPIPSRSWRELGCALVLAGQHERAQALAAARTDPEEGDRIREGMLRAFAEDGAYDRAELLLRTLSTERAKMDARQSFVGALVEAGEFERAVDVAVEETWPRELGQVVDGLLRAGDFARADGVARSAQQPSLRVDLLTSVAVAMWRAGRRKEAECLLHDLTLVGRDSESIREQRTMVCRTITAFADDDRREEARALLAALPPRPVPEDILGEGMEATALAVLGRYEEAVALAQRPEHALVRGLYLADLARCMIRAGDSARLLTLMEGCDEEERQYAWPDVAEEATERGDYGLAIEAVKRMAGVDRCCVALRRIVRSLAESGDEHDRAWAAHLLEIAAADANVLEEEALKWVKAHGADAVDNDTSPRWRAAAVRAQAAVARARIALGDRDPAARWLAETESELEAAPELLTPTDCFADLAGVSIDLGRYDETEERVDAMDRSDDRDRSRLALVEEYVLIGELDRAAAQAVRIDARSDRAIEAYLLLAEHAPWDEACRWLRLALHHGEWTRALPTLLWAEPTAVRQAMEACTGCE
ncbi:hypothetical protein AB0L47_36825 [Streptomyces bobili]|uniref:hypothetical protein n=1 Tax=Streptomyces bobili TaxID=67280 RepID=UPI00341F87BA